MHAAFARVAAALRRVADHRLLTKAQHEIVLVGGTIVTVGELAAKLLPAGPVRTGLEVGLPIVVTVVQRARTLPVAAVEAIIARIERMNKPKGEAPTA